MPKNGIFDTKNAYESTFLVIFYENSCFEMAQSKYIWVKIENVISLFFAKNLSSPIL